MDNSGPHRAIIGSMVLLSALAPPARGSSLVTGGALLYGRGMDHRKQETSHVRPRGASARLIPTKSPKSTARCITLTAITATAGCSSLTTLMLQLQS